MLHRAVSVGLAVPKVSLVQGGCRALTPLAIHLIVFELPMVEHPIWTRQSNQGAGTLNITFEKFADVKVLLKSVHQASASVG